MNTWLLYALPLLLLILLHSHTITGNDGCHGVVQGKFYNLSMLASAVKNIDQQVIDSLGNTFLYRPCAPLQEKRCATGADPHPAICQKDTRPVPQFHDCGSYSSVTWSSRMEGSGFILTFTGASEGRQSNIEFICDPNAGVGRLGVKTPSEIPQHFYHLAWKSSLVCPRTNLTCCAYRSTESPEKRSLCSKNSTCPSLGFRWVLVEQRGVANCTVCLTPSTCCLYQNPTSMETHTTCDPFCPAKDKQGDRLLASWSVDSCNDCFFDKNKKPNKQK